MSMQLTRLGDLCEVITKGTTPTSMGFEFVDKGISFLRVQNIEGGTVNYKYNTLFIDEKTHQAFSRSQIHPGDVLVSIAGTIGRVGVVPENAPRLNCNQAVAIVRTKREIYRPFLRHWFESGCAKRQMRSATVTGTISNLSLSQIANLQIHLPPLDEQRRIAAILDKADAIHRKRQESIRLTEEFLRSTFLEMFGDPVTNTKGWEIRPLKDVVSIVSGGTPATANADYWDGNIPWVSPKDMKIEEIYDAIDHVSDLAFQQTSLKKIPTSAILLVVRGMILVHTVPIGITRRLVAINQDIKALIAKGTVLPEFLLWNLLAQHDYILSKVATAAHGTKRLEMSEVENLPILLPEIKIQQKFVEIFCKHKVANKKMRSSNMESENLFNSLTHCAFHGEL